ncbi:MAG TPA: hypothetical protein VJM79_03490 [Rhizorhapis sp.]|nr:hypothetical protein [Rhizorhapis sp.]
MIRIAVALMAVAAPASAQIVITFESGKSLPLAAGQWTYVATASGGEARFGSHLSLLCDKPTRTVTITRPGAPVAALTVVTDTHARSIPPNGRLSAYDPLLDAMAFSRGRYLVAGGSAAVLAIPSWPEAARAIEDCRN